MEKFLKQPLERVDGVASIEIWGAQEKSIQILIDQDKVNVDFQSGTGFSTLEVNVELPNRLLEARAS